ncbi:unnamed protein product [Symbiodinium sp. CCMP2456]|nr:unnamed protein product [Symbiodinium sp. CCMP2456]
MSGPTTSQDPLTALLATDPDLGRQLESRVLRFSASRKLQDTQAAQVDRSFEASAKPEVVWSEEERTVYVGKLLRMQHPGQPGAEKAVAQFLKDLLGEVSLPEPWVMLRSSRGRLFFCNMATRQTTWDHPLEGSLLEAATICKQVLQLDEPWRANLTAHLLEVVAEDEEDFLGKWDSVPAGDGLEQFRHTETGLFSWTPPREIAAGLFQCKRAALAKLCDDRYVRQLQLQDPAPAVQLEARKKNISAAIRMLMEAVDDTSQGSRTPSRPASEILPRHVLSGTNSALLAQSDKAGRALSATSGETPLDSRADTPSAHSRTWEAPLPEGDGNLEAEEPNHVDHKPTEEQQEQQLPQDHQEAAQQDLRYDQSAKFVIRDDDDTCEPHARGIVEAEVLPNPAEAVTQPPTKIDESKQQAATPQVPRELQELETAVLAFAQALDEDMQVGDDDKPHRANQTHCRQADDGDQDWSAPSRPAPPTTTEENLGRDLPDGHEEQCAAVLPGGGTGTSEDCVTRPEPGCEAGSPSAEPRAGEEDLALAALALLQLMTPRIKEETLTEGRLCEAAQVTQTTSSTDACASFAGCKTAPAQDQASLEEAESKEAAVSRQDEAIDFIASHLSRLESTPGMLAREKLSRFLQLLGMNAADIDEALDAAQVADADGFIDYRAFLKWLLEPEPV